MKKLKKKSNYYSRRFTKKTATSPALAIPTSAVMGDREDCVAVGHGVGTVVGILVVLTTAIVVGTGVIA